MAKESKEHYQYQYGNTAHAYTEKVEPLRVPTPAQPAKRPQGQPRRKVDIQFGMQMTLCGAIIFSCAFLYLHSYASLRAKQKQLSQLKDQKIMVTNNMTEIQAKIDEKLDLSKIEEKATKELGMTKPYAHQIIYVELPEKSHTTYQKK